MDGDNGNGGMYDNIPNNGIVLSLILYLNNVCEDFLKLNNISQDTSEKLNMAAAKK